MIPLKNKNAYSRIKDNRAVIGQDRRRPEHPGPYVYVGDYDAQDPPVTTWQSPPWQNDFTWFGTSYVGFRHGLDGWTEFVGVLDLTAGAVSGTVAFTLPAPWRSLTFSYTFPIFVEDTTWQAGVLSVNSDNTSAGYGDVTVYWPIEATSI